MQEDGETGRPLAALPADKRICPGTGPRGRAATARTLALNRAEGILVRALDADDILTEGALSRDIATLTGHSELGWCVSPALKVAADGRRQVATDAQWEPEPTPGALSAGYFLASIERADFLHLPGTTLCTYTDLVRALGGWPAIPANDDVALLLAAEAVSDGWLLSEASLLYRRWQGSTTDEIAPAASQWQRALHTRVYALRASGWRWHGHSKWSQEGLSS